MIDAAAFRRAETAQALAKVIQTEAARRPMTFMEVCGTHTMAIARYGLRELLPPEIRLISGPGCPVCVTSGEFVDRAVALALTPGLRVATFGDMVRVPGSRGSLEAASAQGGRVNVVSSTLEALRLAQDHPQEIVVFLGVGFETTAPTVAAALDEARSQQIENFTVLSANKTMPQALAALCAGDLAVDGFLLPGHVSAIIGSAPYGFLPRERGVGGVISGFEPLDILDSIRRLARQVCLERPEIDNQYSRVVRPQGNPEALALMDRVFEPCDASWRGLGVIPGSGLEIRPEWAAFDAASRFDVAVEPSVEPQGCRCGEVLTGRIAPDACGLFGQGCDPDHPIGPCMVSSEGTCAAYFRYDLRTRP